MDEVRPAALEALVVEKELKHVRALGTLEQQRFAACPATLERRGSGSAPLLSTGLGGAAFEPHAAKRSDVTCRGVKSSPTQDAPSARQPAASHPG